MVSDREKIDSMSEEFARRGLGKAVPAGEVLAVGDDEFGRVALDEFRQDDGDGPTPGPTDDVAQKENLQCAYSVIRVSRMTRTLIWPGKSTSSPIFLAIFLATSAASRSEILSCLTKTRSSLPAWIA